MKSAQLVTFLAIASLIAGCNSQESSVDDSGVSDKAAVDAGSHIAVDASVEINQALSKKTSQVSATSAQALEGFVSSPDPSYPKSAQATRDSLGDGAAVKAKSSSVLVSSQAGRDNPFALAAQPDFEVRFVPAKASNSLPPVPNVGLGPEPGASLQPVSAVAQPMALRPAVPTVLVPQEQEPISFIPASPSALLPSNEPPVVSPTTGLAEAVSPTALAEAVEIKGVVQLGDQIAVIVNEGEGKLSRTVQPGARLAGGQVELRRIDTTAAEPQVVLVQNGVEIVRGVGV